MLGILQLLIVSSFLNGPEDSFLRKNEVPVSGIPTVRVEVPYYLGPGENEVELSFEERTAHNLFSSKEDALRKCESSYESLLARIQDQLEGIIVMKMEKCQITGPHQTFRGEDKDGPPFTFFRYEAYVSFLQAPARVLARELQNEIEAEVSEISQD